VDHSRKWVKDDQAVNGVKILPIPGDQRETTIESGGRDQCVWQSDALLSYPNVLDFEGTCRYLLPSPNLLAGRRSRWPAAGKSSSRILLSSEARDTFEPWQRSTTIAAGLARLGKIILLLATGHSWSGQGFKPVNV
jgi:hypothetical protein